MKVSKNWLKDYLNLDNITDEELFKEISFHISEIESYKKMVEATNLTIGHVLECEDHPDSDHLHVCQVEVAPGNVQQIVCGAPNVCKGAKVIVANVGAVLPGNFKIKASKIRGVESNGMLCSLQELGIEDKYIEERFKNGIYLLDEDAEVGECPLEYLGLDDTIIDLELTSNRSDLLSIEGVAYDLGAVLNQTVSPIIPEIEECDIKNPVSVSVETDRCYKYNARYIANIKIEESPQWMKARLIASGIRPISNVVDITNFVLLEMGQPLHAFDADLLGNTIVVRNAKPGEKLKTLDNIERELSPEDCVITDGKEAVCVGGVMGGLTTEIDSNTTNVILEGAYFDPLSIRKTSTKLGLKSESSVRFERKIDYDRVERALDYAAQLIQEICGGQIYKGVASKVRVTVEPKYVKATTAKINSILGTDLEDSYVEEIFNRLAYTYTKNGLEYTITLPSRRMDLEPSIQDIVEDVARINGYDNIPTTIAQTRDKGALTHVQKRTRLVRQILANMGLNEVVSYSLIALKDIDHYTSMQSVLTTPVEVMMPMTEDRAVMRKSLLNGVIDAIAYNKARKIDNLALYEIGKVYSMEKEETKLAIAMTGLFSSHLWNGVKQEASFYLLKGIAEALFSKLNVSVIYKPDNEIKSFHPGRCAGIYLNDKKIGVIGQMHPKFSKDMSIGTTIALEISLEAILEADNGLKYHPINKFPSVQRDLAIVCKKDVKAEEVLTLVRQTARKYLTKLELFDVYMGENVGADEKSLAFKMTLEDSTKTLETAEVEKVISQILNRLERELGAKLR